MNLKVLGLIALTLATSLVVGSNNPASSNQTAPSTILVADKSKPSNTTNSDRMGNQPSGAMNNDRMSQPGGAMSNDHMNQPGGAMSNDHMNQPGGAMGK